MPPAGTIVPTELYCDLTELLYLVCKVCCSDGCALSTIGQPDGLVVLGSTDARCGERLGDTMRGARPRTSCVLLAGERELTASLGAGMDAPGGGEANLLGVISLCGLSGEATNDNDTCVGNAGDISARFGTLGIPAVPGIMDNRGSDAVLDLMMPDCCMAASRPGNQRGSAAGEKVAREGNTGVDGGRTLPPCIEERVAITGVEGSKRIGIWGLDAEGTRSNVAVEGGRDNVKADDSKYSISGFICDTLTDRLAPKRLCSLTVPWLLSKRACPIEVSIKSLTSDCCNSDSCDTSRLSTRLHASCSSESSRSLTWLAGHSRSSVGGSQPSRFSTWVPVPSRSCSCETKTR